VPMWRAKTRQAAHTCDHGKRESGSGPLRSRAGCFWQPDAVRGEVQRRCAAAETSARLAPPEHGGGRPAVGPTLARSFGSGGDRSLSTEVRTRSADRVHTGSTRAPDPYRGHPRGLAAGIRGSTLIPPSPGTSPWEHAGARWLATAAPRPGLRQRIKALRPTAASGAETAVRKPPIGQPQRPETARGHRPPVTAGRLLKREKAPKGRA